MTIHSTYLTKITDLDSNAFQTCMQLYENSFPPEERKSFASIKVLLEKQVYCLYALELVPQCTIIGFALIMLHKKPDFLFIDNIAIDKAWQGKGYGSELIRQVTASQSSQSLGVFLEVEKPELADDSADRRVREKRLDFYSALGFIPFKDIPYLFPVQNDTPIPLLLMFKPAPGVHKLTAETVKQMIKAVYYNIHSDVDNLEDILESFMDTIRGQVL